MYSVSMLVRCLIVTSFCLIGCVLSGCLGSHAEYCDGPSSSEGEGCRPRSGAKSDFVLNGRIVLRDRAGRDRIVMDPELGLELVGVEGKTVAWLQFGENPNEAWLGLGRHVVPSSGLLPERFRAGLVMGLYSTGAVVLLTDATGTISMSPSDGIKASR